MEALEFFSESEAELLRDIPCFDPFSAISWSDRKDIADYYASPITWCDLASVERYLAWYHYLARSGDHPLATFPR